TRRLNAENRRGFAPTRAGRSSSRTAYMLLHGGKTEEVSCQAPTTTRRLFLRKLRSSAWPRSLARMSRSLHHVQRLKWHFGRKTSYVAVAGVSARQVICCGGCTTAKCDLGDRLSCPRLVKVACIGRVVKLHPATTCKRCKTVFLF